jgi:hypothetical protein
LRQIPLAARGEEPREEHKGNLDTLTHARQRMSRGRAIANANSPKRWVAHKMPADEFTPLVGAIVAGFTPAIRPECRSLLAGASDTKRSPASRLRQGDGR